MPIDEIIQPEDPNAELLLTETVAGTEGDDTIDADSKEPLDEIEYPETLDDDAPADETPAMKALRERHKADHREKAQLRKEIEDLRNRKPVARTEKPTLAACDWDEDKLADELFKWKANEAAADEAERAPVDNSRNQAAEQWQQELRTYKDRAAKLGKPDFDAAENAVISTLDPAQQSTIVMAAKDPARFIYALGRSPNRLAQLAEITNPIKLAAEVARIEGARIMARKEPANIDTPLRGSARLSSPGPDKELERLEKEADRTGDRTKVIAYNRQQRRAKAA